MKVVRAEGLSKVFPQGKRAVDNVSFSLEEGQVFGFLGPNGAGKTTMVKLLNGMLAPTEGRCFVFDMNPAETPEGIHKLSGVITEHAQMYDNLTGLQNLTFFAAMFGIGGAEGEKRAAELLETLELLDAKDRKLSAYSTGMRQRLSLARALIHRPKILFLDEPTSGLDPESAQSVNRLIQRLAQDQGTTVFLCTHQLRYAQEICTHYGLIDEGTLLAAGDIESLRAMIFSGMTLTLKADRLPEGLPVQKTEEGYAEMKVGSEEEIPAIVRKIVEAGGNLSHVSARELSLEEIYFALIERRGEHRGERS